MPSDLPRIDLIEVVGDKRNIERLGMGGVNSNFAFFCPNERAIRRAMVKQASVFNSELTEDGSSLYSRIYMAACSNCRYVQFIALYQTQDGLRLNIINRDETEANSKYVPKSVAYYIREAEMCYGSGANSASVAMYRAALEQFLYAHGFTDGMLQRKITDAEKKAQDGTAPRWLIELDREYFEIIKELGNSSIHPNGGDISAQHKLDTELLNNIQVLFAELLYKAYEEPAKAEERKALLRSRITPKPTAKTT